MAGDGRWQLLVQRRVLREATAPHDHMRVPRQPECGQAVAEQVAVDVQRLARAGIAGFGECDHRAGVGGTAAQMAFDHRQSTAGDVTLDAALQAAGAVDQRQAVALQQVAGHAPVAPFAGQAVEAGQQAAVQAETTACTGRSTAGRCRSAAGAAGGPADPTPRCGRSVPARSR
ncbi:hypothetical protein G6F59_016273 [Rhizopus arrhizus]|nr:hypothetical protein G6F59_016273 [Rhizopus arrhizus]